MSIWTHAASFTQSPGAVAHLFAARYFGEPREVAPPGVVGSWDDRGVYHGTFALVDGVRRYSIEGRAGFWSVGVIEEGGDD